VRQDYADSYRDLYNHHWWWRARERVVLDLLEARKPPGGWAKILDVGCGDGLLFDQLLQFGEVEGVEVSPTLVRDDGPHRSRIHIGDFNQSLGLERDLSLILMLDVLEHLPDPVAALAYALELLAPDGRVLVTVPAFNRLWTNHDIINLHHTRYTKTSFRTLAGQAGLHIEIERYFFHWLFPVKLVAGAMERALDSHPRPPHVPPLWLNKALYWFSVLENNAASAFPLPWGSSLLAFGSRDKSRVDASNRWNSVSDNPKNKSAADQRESWKA
jgi:SAM-dependent methyltransferase